MLRRATRLVAAAVTLAAASAAGLCAYAFAPTLFGAESMIVSSGSMLPAMPVGSVAVTRMVDAVEIVEGDIISFQEPGASMPTTHRVMSIAEENGARVFTTKGDANETDDPNPAVFRGPVHRVERVIPFAGTIVGAARSPAGGVALFLVPMLGIALERRRKPRAVPAVVPTVADAGWSASTLALATAPPAEQVRRPAPIAG